MKSFKLFLLASLVILFSSALYGSDTNCVDNNRTEQGAGVIIDGVCVDPPTLPYDPKSPCNEDERLDQATTTCIPGTVVDDPGPYPPLLECPPGERPNQSTNECVDLPNNPPVADAGTDQDVDTLSTVTLDGSGSSDANPEDSLIYNWGITTKPIGSGAALSSTTAVKPTFTADKDGDYVIQLIVNDGTVDSAPDTVTVTATTVSGIFHNGTSYDTVTSSTTGRVWLDRNLGADRVCVTFDDTVCYGDYYQWGRNFDGHQDSASPKTAAQASNVTTVGHGNFITSTGGQQYDWGYVADQNGNTRKANWSKIDGTSVCPVGYRVPTRTELLAETDYGWAIWDHLSAFAHSLKLPTSGARGSDTGALAQQGSIGNIWSSSVNDLGTGYYFWSDSLYYYNLEADVAADAARGTGLPVRCIKP